MVGTKSLSGCVILYDVNDAMNTFLLNRDPWENKFSDMRIKW